MKKIFVKTDCRGNGFYFTISKKNVEEYISNRKIIKNLKNFTHNSLLNLDTLLSIKQNHTGTEFEKLIRHSISEGKNIGNRQIVYWLRRGFNRKKSRLKIREVQKKECC